MLWNRPLWAYAFVTSLHISLTGSSPLRPIPSDTGTIKYLRRAQQILPLSTQAASWPSNHAPKTAAGDRDGRTTSYELPVVSEVFKSMAMDANQPENQPALPAVAASPPTPTPVVYPTIDANRQPENHAPPSVAVGPPTPTSIFDPTGPLQMIGPGIVVVPTLAPTVLPESRPSTTDSASSDIHPYPVPVRKLIIIGSVMGAILVSTLLSFLLLNRRSLAFCRRKKSKRQSWVTFGSTSDVEKEPKGKGNEKDLSVPPWLLLSSPLSSNGSTIVPTTPEAKSTPRPQPRVIDISPDFPRSKFSVTSSDYPCSPSSSNPSFLSAPSTLTRDPAVPAPLMTPAEFFCLPSASDLQSARHSRIRSEPVFGHLLPTPSQSLATIRSGEHRRSKSVSGLVYIVPPVCESPDQKDGSEWTGSPPSVAGDDLRAS